MTCNLVGPASNIYVNNRYLKWNLITNLTFLTLIAIKSVIISLYSKDESVESLAGFDNVFWCNVDCR